MERLRMRADTQAKQHGITDHPGSSVGSRQRAILLPAESNAVRQPADEGRASVENGLEQLKMDIAAIHHIQAACLEHALQVCGFGTVGGRYLRIARNALEHLELKMHL